MKINNYFNFKQIDLKTIAIILWLVVGCSMGARQFNLYRIVSQVVKTISSLPHYFDDAQKRIDERWENFDEQMAASHVEFVQQSKAFHEEVQRREDRIYDYLGLSPKALAEADKEEAKRKNQPAPKKFSDIQKEWNEGMVASYREGNEFKPDKNTNHQSN